MKLERSGVKGIFPAMVTPTDGEGNVNPEMAKKITNFLIDSGVTALVPVGGTGEFVSLSPSDRIEMVETVVQETAGRVPVVPGVLTPGLKEAVEAGIEFKKAGADGVLLLTPFYISPNQDAIRGFYNEFTSRVGLPVVLYDNPPRTNLKLEPETIKKLVDENDLVVGYKIANPDIPDFCRTKAYVGDTIGLLAGWEHMFTANMILGAHGGLLATSNVFPKAWVKICELCIDGDFVNAQRLHTDLVPFLDVAFSEGFPGLIKEAMALLGYDVGLAQKPIAKPSRAAVDKLRAIAKPLIENPIENRL